MSPPDREQSSPEALPAQAQEHPVARGKLRIYFGASAGVGKTCAMLTAARKLQADGLDVLVGIVETHGCGDTAALLDGLSVLARKATEYRGKPYEEFNLEAALARRPALILVDELAHSNAAGSRHRKRWQDVVELLDAGIDVFSTLDVQHLESLNDAVSCITGIHVAETLPDKVFDQADEVVLVDVPVDELLARLNAGEVSRTRQTEHEPQNFFRKGNLIALRELALRRATNRIEFGHAGIENPSSSAALHGNGAEGDAVPQDEPDGRTQGRAARRKRYIWAAGASLLTALATAPLLPYLDLANIAMLFLLTVVLVSVRLGRGPSVAATLVAVASFNFFFLPPRFSFAVADLQYTVTFLVMLAVGLITGNLTAGLRYQARIAAHRESRSRALYEFARALSAVLETEQIFEITRSFIQRTFHAQATLLLPDDAGRLQYPPPSVHGDDCKAPHLSVLDMVTAQWTFDRATPAGTGTDTLPGSSFFYLPLVAPMRTRGVLAIQAQNRPWTLLPEQRKQLDTFAALAAIALERVHYVEVARDALVRMESERLRNSLLAALSHDLRTPLTSLVGLSESLAMSEPLGPAQQELARSLHDEAVRMSNLVVNLLDMARIQSGQVKLNRQWQAFEEVVGCALRANRPQLLRHTVETRLARELPLVSFDAVLIERVLCNLLENAVKYTPPGSRIVIAAKVRIQSLEVMVYDNGPGIPAGREEAIFEKFTRGERESATPGVGLGLSICRAIIEAHGGRIDSAASPEGGAAFVFTLPLGSPPELSFMDDSAS